MLAPNHQAEHACVPATDTDVSSLRAQDSAASSAVAIDALASPEVAFLLVVAGLVLLALRFTCPSLGWTGVALGASLLVVGCSALHALPVAPGGVLMLSFATASLLMEVLAPTGVGLHAAGAVVSLLLAGIHLTGEPPSTHPALVVPAAAAAGVAVAVAARRSLRYRRDRPFQPDQRLIGHGIVVLTADGHTGRGVTGGQLWQLRDRAASLHEGQTVRVIHQHDEWLDVTPVSHLNNW